MRNTKASGKILRTVLCILLAVVATFQARLLTAAPPEDQETVISIGILNLRDESGSGRTDLSAKLTQQLRQRLFEIYPDLLPKMLGKEAGADPVRGMTVEELTGLGRQYGVLYVLRGGLMPARLETGQGASEVKVNLYAEMVSTDTGAMKSLRGSGTGIQELSESSGLEWERVDFSSAEFKESALGQALSNGLDQLAEAVHEELVSLSENAQPPPVEAQLSEETPTANEWEDAAPEGDTRTEEELPAEDGWAEMDPMEDAFEEPSAGFAATESTEEQELLQLIADAETLLAAGSESNPELADRINNALNDLHNALATQADQLQRGDVSEETNLAVQEARAKLQEAMDEIYESEAMAGTYAPDATASGQSPDSLTYANTITDEVTALIQKIQGLRETLQGTDEDAYPTGDETEYGDVSDNYYLGEGEPEQTDGPEDDDMTWDDPGYEEMSEEDMEEVSGVILEDGEPVEGAEVFDTVSGARATTGNDGSYMLPIPAGTVSNLQVSAQGKRVATGRLQVIGGGSNVADFPISSASEGNNGVRVLSSTAITRAVKTPSGTLKGIVQDVGNRPIPFAIVQVPGVGVVRTNSLGQYTFMNVPSGSYQVKVQQTGFEPQVSPTGIHPGETTRITVRMTKVVPDTVKIPSPILISRISGAMLQGQILDNQGKPLPGVKISAIRQSAAVSTSTGREGKYALRNLSPGAYRIVASKAGFQTAAEGIDLAAGKTLRRNFNMSRISAVVVPLRKAAEKSRGTLEGKVRGEDSEALAGALIEARATEGKQSPLRISTGKDGGFAMKMPEGQYRLEIQRSGYLTYSRNVKISAGKTTRRDFRLRRAVEHVKQETAKIASLGAIGKASPQSTDKTTSGTAVSVPRISDSEISRITATQKAAVVKDRNGRIEGRITDSRTRRGIADASVTLEKAGNTKSDRSGAFKLEAVKPGRYRLSVSAKGYLSTKKTITVTEGRTLKVNVDLTQPVKTVAPPATIKKIK